MRNTLEEINILKSLLNEEIMDIEKEIKEETSKCIRSDLEKYKLRLIVLKNKLQADELVIKIKESDKNGKTN